MLSTINNLQNGRRINVICFLLQSLNGKRDHCGLPKSFSVFACTFIWMKMQGGTKDVSLFTANQRGWECSSNTGEEWMWFSLNRIYLRFKQPFLPRGIKLPFKCLFPNILHITAITFRWLKHMHGIIVYASCHFIHFPSAVLYFETTLMSLDLGLAKMGNLNQGNHYFRRAFWHSITDLFLFFLSFLRRDG